MAVSRKLSLYPSSMSTVEWAEVAPAVRNSAFFSATVEDEHLLAALKKLVDMGEEEGWSPAEFVENALHMMDNIKLDPEAREAETFKDSFNTLYDPKRLRLVFRTQGELAYGYKQLQEEFNGVNLQVYPGWKFVRQAGAKEKQKRVDHVKHENAVRLKTDIQFWLDRNSFDQGGFGNPYAPWGFNSWMRSQPVNRKTCEELGLLKKGQKMEIPAAYAEWGISSAIKSIGRAGTANLTPEQQQNVIERCAEDGIKVEASDGMLQVMPDSNKQEDELLKLQEMETEAWIEDEMKRMEDMSAEDLLKEILGE